jgi:hypothetical protein
MGRNWVHTIDDLIDEVGSRSKDGCDEPRKEGSGYRGVARTISLNSYPEHTPQSRENVRSQAGSPTYSNMYTTRPRDASTMPSCHHAHHPSQRQRTDHADEHRRDGEEWDPRLCRGANAGSCSEERVGGGPGLGGGVVEDGGLIVSVIDDPGRGGQSILLSRLVEGTAIKSGCEGGRGKRTGDFEACVTGIAGGEERLEGWTGLGWTARR